MTGKATVPPSGFRVCNCCGREYEVPEEPARAMAGEVVTIRLTREEASRLELATAEVPYLLGHAEQTFALLWSGHASGFLEGQTGLVSLFELCSRAFKHAADTEGEAISSFDMKLRAAIGEVARAQMEEQTRNQLEAMIGGRQPE